MFISKLDAITRRAFMHRSAQFAALGGAASYALGLSHLGQAAAFNAGNDYKALVCIFMFGGNDYANTFVPYDPTNHARYLAIRGRVADGSGIGIERDQLHATALATPSGQTLTDNMQFALSPSMPRLKALFDQGRMAPLLNVGPLVAPLTRAQYDSTNLTANPRPAKLFSHNDQQSTWQAYGPEGETIGWGGRIADLARSSNSNAIFTSISAAGNVVFSSGDETFAYQVSGGGAVEVDGVTSPVFGSSSASAALRALMTANRGHVLEGDLTRTGKRSIDAAKFLNDAIAPVNIATAFPGSGLGAQLRIVARMIAARQAMGVKRQVFFVGTGGFDTHDNIAGRHEGLVGGVDAAMDAFYKASVELGVADKVTAFTASDFGRTLASNGDGSDHGWGGHHWIVGGAVNGGRFYGRAPHVSLETPDQVGNGRLLPDVSVDQYVATLGRWFGVSNSELATIAPNIGRFASSDLGFMG